MKRLSIFVLMIFLLVSLTGCSEEEHIKLTETESNSIAQYCAYLLMKYDQNKTDYIKLYDYDDLQDAKEVRAQEEEKKRKEQERIDARTATPTPIPDKEPDNPSDTDVPEITPTEIPDGAEVTPVPTQIPTVESISEALGITDFDISFIDMTVTESYQSPTEYFNFKAKEGKLLTVCRFNVKNVSDRDKIFDATEIKSKYYLYTNKTSHDPMVSLLTEDLQFLNLAVKSGSSAEAVLVFSVDKDEEPDLLKIVGNQTYILYLK